MNVVIEEIKKAARFSLVAAGALYFVVAIVWLVGGTCLLPGSVICN